MWLFLQSSLMPEILGKPGGGCSTSSSALLCFSASFFLRCILASKTIYLTRFFFFNFAAGKMWGLWFLDKKLLQFLSEVIIWTCWAPSHKINHSPTVSWSDWVQGNCSSMGDLTAASLCLWASYQEERARLLEHCMAGSWEAKDINWNHRGLHWI